MTRIERAVLDAARAWQAARKRNPRDPRGAAVEDSDLGAAVDALDAQHKAGPRTVAELSVRAQNALATVNGWQGEAYRKIRIGSEEFHRFHARLDRLATVKGIFRAGRKAFARQPNVGAATIAELESVLCATGYADRIEDWRAR